MLNLNKIFDSFIDQQVDDLEETTLLIDFSEHPLYMLGGFNKIIKNRKFFQKYTIGLFAQHSPQIPSSKVKLIAEQLMFDKAWDFIKNFKPNNEFHVECLKMKASDDFLLNIELIIKYYENKEEYEKCAFLIKIYDKLKTLLS
mgnify:CR=1 FL=1